MAILIPIGLKTIFRGLSLTNHDCYKHLRMAYAFFDVRFPIMHHQLLALSGRQLA